VKRDRIRKKLSRIERGALAAGVAAALLSACSLDDPYEKTDAETGPPWCGSDEDCHDGELCRHGSCTPPGQYGACNNHREACGAPGGCLMDRDKTGVCTWRCEEDSDCWPGPAGEQATVRCLPAEPPGPEIKSCVFDCRDGHPCPSGMTCSLLGWCGHLTDGCDVGGIPLEPGGCACDAMSYACGGSSSRPECCDGDPPEGPPPGPGPSPGDGSCCVYCDIGKPCGNSCIALEFECEVGPGCAC